MKQTMVNLGSGTHIQKDYINIDNFELSAEKSFIKADITKELPIKSNSIDYIICDQVLEHIQMSDIVPVLYEIRRVLKKGGRCVIIVPDFEDAARQWINAELNRTFEPGRYKWFSEVVYGNQEHEGEFHKTPMCARYLDFNLNMVGLTNHKILFFPAMGEIPDYPGMRPYDKGAKLRNAQLVCDIVK